MENSAQTTFRLSPFSFRSQLIIYCENILFWNKIWEDAESIEATKSLAKFTDVFVKKLEIVFVHIFLLGRPKKSAITEP